MPLRGPFEDAVQLPFCAQGGTIVHATESCCADSSHWSGSDATTECAEPRSYSSVPRVADPEFSDLPKRSPSPKVTLAATLVPADATPRRPEIQGIGSGSADTDTPMSPIMLEVHPS